MAILHQLKIGKERLDNLLIGRKKVEIRLNDRDYQVDDFLKFIGETEHFGSIHYLKITHVHSGLGMAENYVALSVINVVKGDVNATAK